jgi:anti-sigma factor RsiW
MISADCDAIRDDLDAFVDGELRGGTLRLVARHVESCSRCADEIEARASLGGQLRDALASTYEAPMPEGLAAGVVARVRAESALSLRALMRRGAEDWHWALVGGGAVTATFVSTVLSAALVLLGMMSPSAGSLSAMGQAMRTPAGPLYAEVSRQGADQKVIVVQLNTGSSAALQPPPYLGRQSEEAQWVGELADQLAASGHAGDWASFSPEEREYTQWLLANITRARLASPRVGASEGLTLHRLHLVTNTEVTAKGLVP